jgi:dipeptidyl aminopeptidase/acylaminoacyl peptidase
MARVRPVRSIAAVATVLIAATPISASQARPVAARESGRLVVITKGLELAVLKPDGTGLRKLTRLMPGINSPRWSPDGTRVAFARYGRHRWSAKTQVYVLRVQGGRRRPVGQGYLPRWSPNGRRLMFVDVHGLNVSPIGDKPPVAGRIVVVDVASGRRRVIGRGELPTWSPDGKRVAFFRYTYSKEHTWSVDGSRLLTMNADGSAVRVIAAGPGEPYALYAPEWSPDGRTIAVWGQLVDSGTGMTRQLARDFFPRPVEWSRDGSRIAFTASTSDSDVVATVDVATGDVRVLARVDRRSGLFGSVRWSPNGKQVGFGRCVYDPEYRCWVHTVNADGSRLRRVVEIFDAFDAFDWGRS